LNQNNSLFFIHDKRNLLWSTPAAVHIVIDKHSYNNLREVRVVAGRRTWDTFAGRGRKPLRGGREVHPCTAVPRPYCIVALEFSFMAARSEHGKGTALLVGIGHGLTV